MNSKICIVCPRGCMLDYEYVTDELKVYKNACARGPKYLEQELKHPKRMLTTTMKISGGLDEVIPVHSSEYVNKEDVFSIIKQLKEVSLKAPIKCNDIIIKDLNGTGIDILASKDILETN